MAIKIFKKYREKLGLSRYRCAIELGLGIGQGEKIQRIEESKIKKTYKWSIFQYFCKMGREIGKSDTQIIDDVLGVKEK